MVNTWAKPCHDPDLDVVHESLTRRAGRKRNIPMELAALVEVTSREESLSAQTVSDAIWSLIHTGKVDQTDKGFLITEKFSGTFRIPGFGRGEPVSLVAQRLGDRDTVYPDEASEASRTNGTTSRNRRPGVKQRSAQNEVGPGTGKLRVQLCRDFFPSLVEDHGLETIPRDLYWRALVSQVKRLELVYRVNTPFVRQMMEEFVQHPEWCRRSHRPAWRVFVSRWQELVKRVHAQHNRARRNDTRHTGGIEHWLGEYA
jgi:hypothetical protein